MARLNCASNKTVEMSILIIFVLLILPVRTRNIFPCSSLMTCVFSLLRHTFRETTYTVCPFRINSYIKSAYMLLLWKLIKSFAVKSSTFILCLSNSLFLLIFLRNLLLEFRIKSNRERHCFCRLHSCEHPLFYNPPYQPKHTEKPYYNPRYYRSHD